MALEPVHTALFVLAILMPALSLLCVMWALLRVDQDRRVLGALYLPLVWVGGLALFLIGTWSFPDSPGSFRFFITLQPLVLLGVVIALLVRLPRHRGLVAISAIPNGLIAGGAAFAGAMFSEGTWP